MKKMLLILVLSTLLTEARAGFSIGYFLVNRSMLQFSTNPERFLIGDLRLQTNAFISNSNIEIAPFINLKRKENFNIYSGFGISINPFNPVANTNLVNGYFITGGARIKPLKNKQIALLFEVSPYVNNSFGSAIIRTNLGFSYSFKRSNHKSLTGVSAHRH